MDSDGGDVDLPDRITRFVAGLNVGLDRRGSTGTHSHRKAQLLYTMEGSLKVDTPAGLWLVPSSCALWIPGGTIHDTRSDGSARIGCIFLEPDIEGKLPDRCVMVLVRPLLRELMLRVLKNGTQPVDAAQERRLAGVLIDEITAAPEPVHDLPRPKDPRLLKLVNGLVDAPSRRITLGDRAGLVGASERTLNRLLSRELGITFSQLRQRLHIRMALHELSQGKHVGTIAFELGYDSSSAFIVMFKTIMGMTPARYTEQSRLKPS